MELLPASSEALVQTPIEPKLFFANERTYLHCARAHLPFREPWLDRRLMSPTPRAQGCTHA